MRCSSTRSPGSPAGSRKWMVASAVPARPSGRSAGIWQPGGVSTIVRPMRVFLIQDSFVELEQPPKTLPGNAYLWIASVRREFETDLPQVQAALHHLGGGALVDLHVSDLLNHQLPSHFDYTSWYDLLVFRRLAPGLGTEPAANDESK